MFEGMYDPNKTKQMFDDLDKERRKLDKHGNPIYTEKDMVAAGPLTLPGIDEKGYVEIDPEDFFGEDDLKKIGESIPEEEIRTAYRINKQMDDLQNSSEKIKEKVELPENLKSFVNVALVKFQDEILKKFDLNQISEEDFSAELRNIKKSLEGELSTSGVVQRQIINNAFFEESSRMINNKVGNGLIYSKAEKLIYILHRVFVGVEVTTKV